MRGGVDISVVIPTHDRAAALERCLEGLAAQTRRGGDLHFEVIVVDDGSTDGTDRVVEAFDRRPAAPPVTLIRNDRNRGANVSRNRGVRAANGELVAFLDSDCVPAADWLAQLVDAFETESVAAVTGRVESPAPRNVFELALNDDALILGSGPAPRLVAGNLAVRRSVLRRLPFDEDLKWGCDEEGLYLRIRAEGLEQRLAPDARVLHDHPFGGRSFFRYAWRSGGAAAWLVYKYRLAPRRDVLPFVLAWWSLPLAVAGFRWLLVPAALLAAGAGGLLYVLLFRKLRTLRQAIAALPVYVAYYLVRSASYIVQALRLRLGATAVRRVRLSRSS